MRKRGQRTSLTESIKPKKQVAFMQPPNRFKTTEQKTQTTSRDLLIKSHSLQDSKQTADQHLTVQSKVLRDLKRKWILNHILTKLKSITIPVRHRGSEPVKQQWQKNEQYQEEVDDYSPYLFKRLDWPFVLIQLLLSFAYVGFGWFSSVDLVVGVRADTRPVLLAWLLVLMLDLLITLNTVQIGINFVCRTRMKIFYHYVRTEAYYDGFMLVFVIVMLVHPPWEIQAAFQAVVIIVIIYKLILKTGKVRVQLDSLKQIVLVDSFLLLLLIAHISGLMLYLSSLYSPDDNWMTRLHISSSSWSTQYLYSFYWSCTTIVTVGYGDITPTNECEIFVTILVQLSGSAVFGYLINIIGMTMGELKKDKQNLDEELSITEKLIKILNLKDDLSYKLRSFLNDHQKASNYFSLKDETRIMDKLKPDLRNQIMQQTNIKVIKGCLFFLTYFSRGIQDIIALKLIKRIFQPNQLIGVNTHLRSIYIINQGKVDIQAYKLHYNKPIYKSLRTISKTSKDQTITSNVYGYTALLLKRNISLSAISKEFTVTYELNQEDYENCINQHPLDFEGLCQLRDLIMTTYIPESIEGPQLVDYKLHYVPLRFLILKKYHANCKQPRVRSHTYSERYRFNKYEFVTEVEGSYESKSLCSKPCSMGKIAMSRMYLTQEAKVDEVIESFEQEWFENFDQVKSYTKYFTHSNLANVIRKFCPHDLPGFISTHELKRRAGLILKPPQMLAPLNLTLND